MRLSYRLYILGEFWKFDEIKRIFFVFLFGYFLYLKLWDYFLWWNFLLMEICLYDCFILLWLFGKMCMKDLCIIK